MSADSPVPPARAALWGGRVLSGLVSAFMLFDGALKLFKPEPVVEATLALGYPEGVIVPLMSSTM